MIYIDSCALVKLVRIEEGSVELQAWLDQRTDVLLVTSELALAEVVRVVRRNNHTSQGILVDAEQLALDLIDTEEILGSVDQVALDRELLIRAGASEGPMMRTLDAIHLVSALTMARDRPDGHTFVTYDRRLATAAQETGFVVVAPA